MSHISIKDELCPLCHGLTAAHRVERKRYTDQFTETLLHLQAELAEFKVLLRQYVSFNMSLSHRGRRGEHYPVEIITREIRELKRAISEQQSLVDGVEGLRPGGAMYSRVISDWETRWSNKSHIQSARSASALGRGDSTTPIRQ